MDSPVAGLPCRSVPGGPRTALHPAGRPAPLTHLTRWRLALAADLLAGTDLTLTTIASRVGYANAFALSAAFKRVHGTSPSNYRASHSA